MATLSPARKVALNVLLQAEESGRYARELMPRAAEADGLDPRDAAFALRLALGVTSTVGCLDDALSTHINKPKSLEPAVRMALRLSAFEALYLNAAPEVVVSQGVELARSVSRGAAGLANAVLRRMCENRIAFLAAEDAADDHRSIVSQARRAGLPVWLVRRIVDSLGRDTVERMLSASLEPAPTAVHVNPLRCADELSWLDHGFVAALGLPGAYEGVRVGELVAADAFARADVVASDLHAQLVATAATRSGSCLEIGAGRGTKTFVMHSQAHRADLTRTHVVLDLYEGKCRANAERIDRAGFGGLVTVVGDATNLSEVLSAFDDAAGERVLFDTVFVDAPCSGTGTMRRHAEIPWRLDPMDIKRNLPELQLSMLKEAAGRVAPGGELIYATCSVLRYENGDVVDVFLTSEIGQGFKVAPLSQADIFSNPAFASVSRAIARHEDARGLFQTVPVPHGYDGHFCARLIREPRL